MSKSKIQWTDVTWNPITGCSKISEGCKNCYAEKMTNRLNAMGLEKYKDGFNKVVCHEDLLNEPLKYKKPRKVFVCSMSDLFNEYVDICFIDMVIETMKIAHQHTYQILTKRHYRMLDYFNDYPKEIPDNLWVGVTVENTHAKQRIVQLKKTKAPVKFISFEPLLEDVGELDLSGIDWVIVGGETGAGARECKPEWIENIMNECDRQNVPFFLKGWGSVWSSKNSNDIGDDLKQFPKQKDTQ